MLAEVRENGNLSGAMAKPAQQAAQDANSDYTNWQKSALSSYNNDMGSYMSNVNSQLAAGNPYQSKDYLTSQNLQTSGAMNATNDAAQQQLRDTALRTGTNTAAVAGEVGANRLQGQRDLTTYNAARDTQNEDKWLQQRQQLTSDQLAGANSEAGIYGSAVGGRSAANSDLVNLQQQQDALWGSAIGAVGAAGAGAATKI